MPSRIVVTAICLLAATTGCEAAPQTQAPAPHVSGTEIPLWPASLAITRPERDPEIGDTSGGTGGKQVAGKPWRWSGNVWRPTMTIYPPKGHNTHAALIVFPGGGYQVLAVDLEGTEICDWATAQGMTCAVLKYRVPQDWHPKDKSGHYLYPSQREPVPFLPLQDAQRAMGLIRQHAASLGVDPHKVGVVGFSAGGHLVTAISNAIGRSYKAVDAADALNARPDFAMPIYPGHLWSGDGGPGKDDVKLFAFDPVRADAPPTFIVQAEDDPVDDVRNAIAYFLALREKKVPTEMHIYAHGGHAFGVRPTEQPITHWPDLADKWLHTIGIL